ncbi:MAG: Cadherin proteinputative pre-peptidase, partial [Planctomycetaceae bacterium]|nr:Cadherin proteinputative pre-peptidase [Planctomycetaceae bacterium]
PQQTITYSITGGIDQALFSITPAGVLTYQTAPSFISPGDADHNNVYLVQVTADDGHGGTVAQDLAITVVSTNTLPVFTSNSAINVPENSTAVTTIQATDSDQPQQTITYSITGGIDQALFSITSAGVLTFKTAPSFISPSDADHNNVYVIQVTADDGHGGTIAQPLTISVFSTNNPPVFTSNNSINVTENSTNVLTVGATDHDQPPQTISYSITGGADQALFSITSTGVLTFKTAPSFGSPADADHNNIYLVQVTANDGQGGTASQDLTIMVTQAPPDTITWVKGKTLASIFGTAVVSESNFAGGSLTISATGVGKKKPVDSYVFPSASALGTSTAPQFANGKVTLSLTFNSTAAADAVESFLHGITFATKGAGLNVTTRTVTATITDGAGHSTTLTRTINVKKKA